MDFALLIVAYKPDITLLRKAVLSCSSSMKKVYVLDNTEEPVAEKALQDLKDVTYIAFHKNIGLSVATNIGMQKATEEGIDWVLMLNQDSFFSSDPIETYKKYLSLPKAAILCPKYSTFKKRCEPSQGTERIAFAQTSGSLLSVEAFKKVGPFDENLFVDGSDNDYCFRVLEKGLCIYQINEIVLNHNPGTPRKVRLFGKTIWYSYYAPARKYYLIYSSLYIKDKFRKPSYYWRTRMNMFIKMYVFREKENKESRAFIRKAKKDFKKFRKDSK